MRYNIIQRHKTRKNWLYSGGHLWGARIPIVVNAAQVPSAQSDFPVMVNLANLPAAFFSNVQSAGQDIRVTASDGLTECPVDVATITPGSSVGELHFKASSVDVGSVFYIYFGNPSASAYAVGDTYGRNAVWSNSFAAVLHLEEAVNTSADGYVDSTGNGRHGTGVSMALAAAAGIAGNGQTFDGAADYIYRNAAPVAAYPFTLSAWFKRAGAETSHAFVNLVDKDTTSTYYFVRCLETDDGGSIVMLNTGSQIVTGADKNFTNGSLHHIAGVFVNNTSRLLYTDGAADGSGATSIAYSASVDRFSIGALAYSSPAGFVQGLIDEVRISSTNRSADWIATEYNNQSAPTSFYTVGSIQYL